MVNNYNPIYQYNRCSSRGICSINPTTSALQEVILLFLKYTAILGLQLQKENIDEITIRILVLKTLSILNSDYEISVQNFEIINNAFKTELPKIISKYEDFLKTSFSQDIISNINNLINECININQCIRLGEKAFNERMRNLSAETRNLYKILFVIIKSLCINISTYESYGNIVKEEYITILKMFNLLNNSSENNDELKQIIIDTAKQDCNLMIKIRDIQEEKYGKQSEYNISFSTTKGKCVLVVGSNLKELETVIDKLSDSEIDIYTHDNMILAHTYSKFREYKNLKGQFGQGIENCLLDFSTFPGPIILTEHSLFNIDNLYRGRLYTTDSAYSKGVIPIQNNDFSDVIKSANESKGFKTGKNCNSERFGFDYDNTIKTINNLLSDETYNKIIILGLPGYSQEEKEYFNNLIKRVPKNIFIISFSCCDKGKNIICLNSPSDNYSMLKLSEELIKNTKQKLSLFIPFCNRHMVSIITYLSSLKNFNIFIGKWNQTILNPNITEGLKKYFNILEISSPKKDLSVILEDK